METIDKIKESNRLIVEFMGGKPVEKFFSCDSWDIPEMPGYQHELFYHSSWDWLMPVLKKISDHGCIVEISYALVTSCRICVIGGKTEKAFNIMYNNNDGSGSIVPVWEAVVEYVTYLQSK